MLHESHPRWSAPQVCTMMYIPERKFAFELKDKVKEIASVVEELIKAEKENKEDAKHNTYTLFDILGDLVLLNLPEFKSVAELCLSMLEPSIKIDKKILKGYTKIRNEIRNELTLTF